MDDQLEKLTAAEIGNLIGRNENDVKAHIGRIQLAREFLIHIKKPGYWVYLRDEMNLLEAFKTLQSKSTALKNKKHREMLKKAAFKIMANPDEATKGTGKSVHLLIGETAELIGKDKIKLKEAKKKSPKKIDPLLKPLKKPTKKSDKDGLDIDELTEKELVEIIIDTTKVERIGRRPKMKKHMLINNLNQRLQFWIISLRISIIMRKLDLKNWSIAR